MKNLKEEFLEMLSGYQGILHKVSLIYFKNKEDREDNFQEIVYQLWKSYPKLKKKESIGSWIYAVSINTSISRLKKNGGVEYREKLPEQKHETDFTEKLLMNEQLRMLIHAIHKLSPVDKSIMLLYLEEKSYEEISQITGLTVSNVGVRINRAKKSLKQNLNHQNHDNR
ncbi:MAG: sigma-70 family RNA polymerase sigma factor [Chlorobi bacterium]|nr:sigma-70 family RNA polymerase sigma factor [Chlorobiota bacterium]